MACISIQELLDKHRIKALDLLQIDTEGFDYEIIKMIDFKKIKPKLICFEHLHLSEATKRQCEEHLLKKGYRLEHFRSDSLAILQ